MARNFLKKHKDNPNYFRKIAIDYANSPLTTTMEKIAEQLSLSEGITTKSEMISEENVRTAIELAITTNLISYQDCIKIRNKSDANMHTHYSEKPSKTGKSIKKSRAQHRYDKLLVIRKKFITTNYTEEQIQHAARVYIKNPRMENVWILLGLSKPELNAVLKKGIILGIISEEDYDEMRRISLSKATSQATIGSTYRALESLISLRNDRKRIVDMIEITEYQIQIYDDFVQDGNYPYTKEDLEKTADSFRESLALFDYHVIEAL